MPAGQLKNAAPLGARGAGQSATLEYPAQLELKRPDIGAQHVYSFG